jgi:DNA repair protein RadA/Sms
MKSRSIYVCQNCSYQSPKWAGRCPECGAWGTFVEEVIADSKKSNQTRSANSSVDLKTLEQIEFNQGNRIQTGISELDRVLGGGITTGSLILVGGDPGIGKSTLMLQLCAEVIKHKPLYITGEESLQQIKQRALRLTDIPDSLYLLAETNVQTICTAIEKSDAGVVVVDSIQTMQSTEIESTPGSVSQVRYCAGRLMEVAKKTNKPVFMVGHVTKEGTIAGPKVLEHIVDTVLQFEGEGVYAYRILRALKNRYGSTNEIGIFEMVESGLREVLNPSEIFLSQRSTEESGTAVCASIEGTRPILVEVQALVAPTSYNVPQRAATGFDYKRLQMIIAILEKRLGLHFAQNDVFVNVAGGLTLNDPAVDIGIAAALVSSLRDYPIEQGTVFLGEMGLTGEIRAVSALEQRLNEAQKLGFKRAVVPRQSASKLTRTYSMELLPVERISLALAQLFGGN